MGVTLRRLACFGFILLSLSWAGPVSAYGQPASAITAPIDGAMLRSAVYKITGTGSTNLTKVEVGITPSGGQTAWRLATGTSNWSYPWAPPADGNYTIQSRATDSTGTVEMPGPGVSVTVINDMVTKTVFAWGDNEHGQLGIGTNTDRLSPVPVTYLSSATAIASGYFYTVALRPDGTVSSWGSNYYGQLGDGTTTDRNRPVQTTGLDGVIAVACGYYHTAALKSDGTVWAWGANYSGQLGDGSSTNRHAPVQVTGLGGATVVACGSYYHTIALKSDGTVWTWGGNYNGELGDGTTTNSTAPVEVKLAGGSAPLGGVVAVAGGSDHTVALKSDGTVWAWGANRFGQLGDGTTTERHNPVQVTGLTGVVAIASGENHTIAVKSDGTVWAWGYNAFGELGDGTTTNSSVPVEVRSPDGATPLGGIVAVAGGSNHTVALKSDGTVWTWGLNFYGQLGDGTTTDRHIPVQAEGLTGAVAITAGGAHTAALQYILDVPPPYSSVTAPTDGAALSGVSSTVTGTAVDGAGGSNVMYVDVTTDGGTTWNRATGTVSWSWKWVLPVKGAFRIKSRATDSLGVAEEPGPGVGVTVAAYGSPELQHYNWNAAINGISNCSLCHISKGSFLPSGFRQLDRFCQTCHNPAGVAHDKAEMGVREHPVLVNATSGGGKYPVYGNVTAGEYNNQPFSQLSAGHLMTCVTCHNPMRKTEDYGRTWEYTTTTDRITYVLQRGAWDVYGRVKPVVYRDTSLWAGPGYSKSRGGYQVSPSEYTYDESAGTVTFKTAQAAGVYIYVSLDYPYLRASSQDNRLCSDCHTQVTHEGINCLNCHQAHNTANVAGICANVRTANHTSITVRFLRYTGAGSFAGGSETRDGICRVCHTQTLYYRRDGTGSATHSDGRNYDGKDCTACHSHSTGFAR